MPGEVANEEDLSKVVSGGCGVIWMMSSVRNVSKDGLELFESSSKIFG